MLLLTAAALSFSCVSLPDNDPEPDPGGEDPGEAPVLSLSVDRITSSAALISVTPLDDSFRYFFDLVKRSDYDAWGGDANTIAQNVAYIEHAIEIMEIMGYSATWDDFTNVGPFSETYTGLVPSTEYVLFAFGLDSEGTPTSELVRQAFTTEPFVPEDERTRAERCEEILTIQAMGLKKRLGHTHAKTAVVGISGGLDSTLALLVTAKAFDMLGRDKKDIIAVTMPCFGTTDRTYNNACDMARKTGSTLIEVPIAEAVNIHFRDIGQDPENHDVTYENSQARERTQVLMDIANRTGGMVIGTGDMSELALGWATYNGDHMSMYGVNASVPKTLVRHLVKYAADDAADEKLKAVLYDVLDTPVSPELLPPKDGDIAQKTEDLVGPYELHDFFLYYMLRFGYEPAKIFRLAERTFDGEYDRETILKWLKTFCRRFFSQQFKRSCLPDGPKIGTVALSPRGDWRMPSDACAAVWMKELEEIG